MRSIALAALAVLAACDAEDSVEIEPLEDSAADAQEMIYQSVADYESAEQPCLFDPAADVGPTEPEAKEIAQIRSDAVELERRMRTQYGDRLAYAGVELGEGEPRYIIRLTGKERIADPALGGQSRHVAVIVSYDAPYSLAEVDRRRNAALAETRRLVPGLQGIGYRPELGAGAIQLDVFTPDGDPDPAIIARCDRLRAAYRMPVLIRFHDAPSSEEMGAD